MASARVLSLSRGRGTRVVITESLCAANAILELVLVSQQSVERRDAASLTTTGVELKQLELQ